MNAITEAPKPDRTKFIGGAQSKRVPLLNEGVVRHMYQSGMTQIEIATELRTSQRSVCLFMARCAITSRIAAKRVQAGESNTSWSGDSIGYKGAHARVYAARGRPAACEQCKTTDPSKNYEWANLTGAYHDPADYMRLCRSCHCKHDGLIKNLGKHAKEPHHASR